MVNANNTATENHNDYIKQLAAANVPPQEVDVKMIQEIFAVDAIYINQIFISVDPAGMARICFAEIVPELNAVKARAAVTMPVMGLLSLKANIEKTLDNHLNNIRAAEAKEAHHAQMAANAAEGIKQ